MAGGLVKVSEKVVALASYGTSDLGVQERVDALVATAKEINDTMKAAKADDTAVKDEFKRMCKPYTDEGHGVVCYSFVNGMKMTLSVQGGGMELDENALLAELYRAYGERPGDREGKAWRAYCAISDPVEVPRKLNPDKLASEIAKAQRIASGLESGEVLVNAEMARAATVEKKPVLKAQCSAMTKGELKAHDMGELTETMVIK